MTSITAIMLATADPVVGQRFCSDTLGLNGQVRVRATDAQTDGSRGFTLSLHVEGGLDVAKSFGRKYVGFATGTGGVKLAPYGRSLAS